jgi:hypothetical protein
MFTELLNLTPHDITIFNGKTKEILFVIPASKLILRLEENDREATFLLYDKIPCARSPEYKGLNAEPPKGKDIIVSQLVAEYIASHFEEYRDVGSVFTPDTGFQNGIRNDKGQIIGTTLLLHYK